ncbi:acyl carrier protein [Xanthobacter autotrophicus DSM 431]|uniref:acyl carrier protein n=1 Tax=Xanthobacter nonsaccharivorans TaxID=3119912 RepID=UPI00372847B7
MADIDGRKGEILAVIAEEAGVDPAIVDRDTSVADLGIGSLDLIELIFKIEERFGIEVPSEGPLENTDVKVFELLEHVEKLMDSKPGVRAAKMPS